VNRVRRSSDDNWHEMLAEGRGKAIQGDRVVQPVTSRRFNSTYSLNNP
jgi:hypothetical protein